MIILIALAVLSLLASLANRTRKRHVSTMAAYEERITGLQRSLAAHYDRENILKSEKSSLEVQLKIAKGELERLQSASRANTAKQAEEVKTPQRVKAEEVLRVTVERRRSIG